MLFAASTEFLPKRVKKKMSRMFHPGTDEEMQRMLMKSKTLWFLDSDIPHGDLAFDTHGNVSGGTLPALVEYLSSQQSHESYVEAFLMTFRYFTSPLELIQLFNRCYTPKPPRDIKDECQELWKRFKLKPTQQKIILVLNKWLNDYFYLSYDKTCLDAMWEFVVDRICSDYPVQGDHLLEKIEYYLDVSDDIITSSIITSPPSSPIDIEKEKPSRFFGLMKSVMVLESLTKHQKLHDFDPKEIAIQITLYQNRIFCDIQFWELLKFDHPPSTTPPSFSSVKQLAEINTKLTRSLQLLVLSENDLDKRIRALKFTIKLADEFLQLNNYDALMAVIAAINSSCLRRLHKTWNKISPKYQIILENSQKSLDFKKNYAIYRQHIKKISNHTTCIPFLGIYLTDLTFIEEGNPNTRPRRPVSSPGTESSSNLAQNSLNDVNHLRRKSESALVVHDTSSSSHNIINFDKYYKIYEIIQEIQKFQISYDVFEWKPKLQEFLDLKVFSNQACLKSDDQLYESSLSLEPKTGLSSSNLSSLQS